MRRLISVAAALLVAALGGWLWGMSRLAEPGTEFHTDADALPQLPIRRLVAAGCSIDHCLVNYERGGSAHTWPVVLFHWTPAATRFEWAVARQAPGD